MYPRLHPSMHHHYVPTSSSIHPSSLYTHCFIHPFSSIHHHHPGPGRAKRPFKPRHRPGGQNQSRARHRAQAAKIVGRHETVTEVLGGGGRERPPASPGSPCRRRQNLRHRLSGCSWPKATLKSPMGSPRPHPLPLSQARVHKVTEWRTIQKYHSKD